MTDHVHRTATELEAGLDDVRSSPADEGLLELIVRRPTTDAREKLESGVLDTKEGLVGDDWIHRRSSRTPDGSPHPDTQLTLMNARFARLVAGEDARWELAGDQLYIDLDLSSSNLPPGTRLSIGGAEIEVTSQPHTGCAKFAHRFGTEALKFVNTTEGRELRLRGIYARVVRSGTIRAGDRVVKS